MNSTEKIKRLESTPTQASYKSSRISEKMGILNRSHFTSVDGPGSLSKVCSTPKVSSFAKVKTKSSKEEKISSELNKLKQMRAEAKHGMNRIKEKKNSEKKDSRYNSDESISNLNTAETMSNPFLLVRTESYFKSSEDKESLSSSKANLIKKKSSKTCLFEGSVNFYL